LINVPGCDFDFSLLLDIKFLDHFLERKGILVVFVERDGTKLSRAKPALLGGFKVL
jgi:hypothetical protein